MPAQTRIIDDDLVKVYVADPDPKSKTGRKLKTTLFWGDTVQVREKRDGWWILDFSWSEWDRERGRSTWRTGEAFVKETTRFRDEASPGVLKVRFVDVGQGDGAIIETAKGTLVLVDGGEDEHLRNYFTRAWAHVLRHGPVDVAALVVTHGDADHFSGLPLLVDAENAKGGPAVVVRQVLHNGLVRRPDKLNGRTVKDEDAFGATGKDADGRLCVTELVRDVTRVPLEQCNAPFANWRDALLELRGRNRDLSIERLAYGDTFPVEELRREGVDVEVLGPIPSKVGARPALPLLHVPGGKSWSASHTINGNSIVLRLRYGNVRFLFGADLNEESQRALLARVRQDGGSLASEILKVPHHGSADFSPGLLEAVRAVVSVVSSGDESAKKEYIHPRAGLVGALGRYSRASVAKPLVYVTEMVAFFERLGPVQLRRLRDGEAGSPEVVQRAYDKKQFGIVHVRTDGERVLVATHSGRDDMKESYSFRVTPEGEIVFPEK